MPPENPIWTDPYSPPATPALTCCCTNQCPTCGQCCAVACEHRFPGVNTYTTNAVELHQSAAAPKEERPLKPYRSEAERVAVKQRNTQIALTLLVLVLSALTFLTTQGVI